MRKGFTLIELVIVIIIVGVLASVGVTQYTKVIEKGRATEARMMLGNLRSAQIAEYNENGFNQTVENLSMGAPVDCASQDTHFFKYACEVSNATCTATRCIDGGKRPWFSGTTGYTKTLLINGSWGGTQGY